MEVFKRHVGVALVAWFSGGLSSVWLMIGLKDLTGLFKPKQFYDSIFERALTEVQKT